MRWELLSIERMPGCEQGGPQLESLNAGLNVIVGSNGSGKTTICRALSSLIAVDYLTQRKLRPVLLRAVGHDNGKQWEIKLDGDYAATTCNGMDTPWPLHYAAHEVESFTISGDALFRSSETDQQVLRALLKEMTGGLDLQPLYDELQTTSRFGYAEAEALWQLGREISSITTVEEDLTHEYDQLEHLQAKEKKAKQAEQYCTKVKDAKKLLQLRQRLQKLQEELQQMPPGMQQISGRERDTALRLKEVVENAVQRKREAEKLIEQNQLLLRKANLPDGGIKNTDFHELQKHLQAADECRRDLRIAQQDLASAEQEYHAAATGTFKSANADEYQQLTSLELRNMQNFQAESAALQAKLNEVKAQIEYHRSQEKDVPPETLKEGVDILRRWLRNSQRLPDKRLPVAAAVLGLVLGLVLGATVSAWLFGAVLLCVMLLWTVMLLRTPQPAQQETMRREYAQLKLPEPTSWQSSAVEQQISALERDWDTSRFAQQHAAERQRLTAEYQLLQEQSKAMEQRRELLLQRLGLDDTVLSLEMTVFAQRLQQVEKLWAQALAMRAKCRQLATEQNRHLLRISQIAEAYGFAAVTDHEAAVGVVTDLQERREQWQAAQRNLLAATQSLEDAQADLHRGQVEAAAETQRLGFDLADASALNERLNCLEIYRELKQELVSRQARAEMLQENLAADPELTALSAAELITAEEECVKLINAYAPLVEQIAGIRREVERTRKERPLEKALARQREAWAALQIKKNVAVRNATAKFLLRDIEQEYREQSQPAVVQQASQWFQRFTHHRYALRLQKLDNGSGTFVAHDRSAKRWQQIDELSTGTRMQLLLAARLAYAMAAERGPKLPFVFDEVLNNTDPQRFQAVAECIVELMKDGRQVFYMTCRPEDASAWKYAVPAQMQEYMQVVNLDGLNQIKGGTPMTSESPAVVAPETGESIESYRSRLLLEPLQPQKGAEAVHISYLADDTHDLYALLNMGIRTYGQLAGLMATAAGNAKPIKAEHWQRIQARAAIVDAFRETYNIGRGKPLSRDVLLCAGVTDSFIERIAALAEDLNWDAGALLQALRERSDPRTRRFQTATLEKITGELEASGHYDSRQPLEYEQLLEHVRSQTIHLITERLPAPEEFMMWCKTLWHAAAA